jgi:hypothetical protein
MKTEDIVTTDLANFGARERGMLIDLLTAWQDYGLPAQMGDEVRPYMNRNSGYVFLSDDDGNTCMEADGKLLMHHSTPYNGHEGFATDLADEADNTWHVEDLEYLADALEAEEEDELAAKVRALIA